MDPKKVSFLATEKSREEQRKYRDKEKVWGKVARKLSPQFI